MKYDIIETKERVLADNEQAAASLRSAMEEKHILFIDHRGSLG